MSFDETKNMAVGSKVRVVAPMDVPEWAEWDDDKGRTSAILKKRLMLLFFRGDKKITAEVVYVPKETEREKLRRQGRIKLRLRESSGAMLNITADPSKLTRLR